MMQSNCQAHRLDGRMQPKFIEATPGIVSNIRSVATRAHMPIVSLRDFLDCGRFGLISLGVDRRAIENTFGQPEDVDADSVKGRRAPAIMKYGDVEFTSSPTPA